MIFRVVLFQPYAIRCREDACSAGAENVDESICESLTSYSRLCSYQGVVMSWRGEDLCRKCTRLY